MSDDSDKKAVPADEKMADEGLAVARSSGSGKEAVASPDDAILNEFSPAEQKRIMWHIDRRLVITVGCMYCVSLMDRTNLGAANIAGMQKELGLDIGVRYVSVPPCVFWAFPPY